MLTVKKVENVIQFKEKNKSVHEPPSDGITVADLIHVFSTFLI